MMRHVDVDKREQVCRAVGLLEVHHKHLYLFHLLRIGDVQRGHSQLVKPCDVDNIIHKPCLHARVHLHELVEHRLGHYPIDDGALRIFQ